MIKRMVLWKLKDSHEGMGKDELIAKFEQKVETLKSAVPEIKTMELGKSFSELPVAYDISLYSEYDSKEDYEVFLKHPEHVEVGKFIRQIRTDTALVEYET